MTTRQALARAKATGQPVPVDTYTSPTSTVVAGPDGRLTLTQSAVPVRKHVGSAWVPLDATLKRNADGTVTPAVTTTGLTLSGGGNAPLATMSAAGESLALSFPVTLPAPTLSGPDATYPNVLPGVDLEVTADSQGGFREVFVVKTRAAATNPELARLTFRLAGKGVTVGADATGNLAVKDRTGRVVFNAPAPRMWDSATTAAVAPATDARTGIRIDARIGQPVASSVTGPGAGARSARIAVSTSSTTVDLVPDTALLTGTGTVYPLFLDPNWNTLGPQKSGWASVSEYFPSSNYWDHTPDPQGYLQVGNSGSMWSHTLLNFPIDLSLLGGTSTISSAQLNITEVNSYSCTPSTVNAYAPSTTMTSSNATWNYWNGVGLGSPVASANVAYGYNSSCQQHAVGFPVVSAITGAVSAHRTTQTFVLTGVNESGDHNSWKEFANDATLQISFNRPPNTPQAADLTTSPATACTAATPTAIGDSAVYLYAAVSDPDGLTDPLGVTFQLWKTSAPGTILDSTDPNQLTAASGTRATRIVPEATLKTAAAGAITEFSWHVQISDTITSSAWSVTCNFNFDPTRTGAPRVSDPGATTVGQPVTLTINPPLTGTTPTSYLYQLNGAASAVAPATSGTATITVKPSRFTNVLNVTSLSAGGNVGDTATIVFNTTPPTTALVDQDLTGDGRPDLMTVGAVNGMPAGLWQGTGTDATGQVNPAVTNIGANGDSISGDTLPGDFTGTRPITGRFTGTTLQDVLVYFPTGPNAGGAVILDGEGDGSVLQAQITSNAHPVFTGIFSDGSFNPTQLANAGTIEDTGNTVPDLIGTASDATTTILEFYDSPYNDGTDYYASPLSNVNPPTGTDWSAWTITTCQTSSGPEMFLWNKTTGGLYLWTGLSHAPQSADLPHTQYTIATSAWNTGVSMGLQAADINNDGTADLWTVTAPATAKAYLVTLNGDGTATATPQTAQTLNTANHSWQLNDAPNGNNGTVTTAADMTGSPALPLTGTGDAAWHTGDLYSPDVALNSTPGGSGNGALSASGPAIATDSDFTVSAWVKPTATGGTVLSQDGTQGPGFRLWADAGDGAWHFGMTTGDSASPTYDTAVSAAGSVTLGAWTRLTANYQKSSATITLYVNGAKVATGLHPSAWNATGAFQIGDNRNGATHTNYLAGQVSDVKVWNQTLDPDGGVAPPGSIFSRAANPSDVSGDGRGDLIGQKSDGSLFEYVNNGGSSPYGTGTQIGSGFNVFSQTLAADVSGDGSADLLAVKSDGTLWYYPNNSSTNPGHAPYTTGTQIGYGYNTFSQLTAADINGDGRADLIGVKPDGSLFEYVNSGGSSPYGVGTQIGTGWNAFSTILAADVSGDGSADLLALKSNGELWYYPNNSATNPGHAPFTTGVLVGTGFQVFSRLTAMDVNGDGAADLLAMKPDGTLWYYVNGRGPAPYSSGTQIGSGWNIFSQIF